MVEIGDKIEITSDNNNYDEYKDKEWVVTNVFVGTDEHPLYDTCVYPQQLIECEGLPFLLYKWEFDIVG